MKKILKILSLFSLMLLFPGGCAQPLPLPSGDETKTNITLDGWVDWGFSTHVWILEWLDAPAGATGDVYAFNRLIDIIKTFPYDNFPDSLPGKQLARLSNVQLSLYYYDYYDNRADIDIQSSGHGSFSAFHFGGEAPESVIIRAESAGYKTIEKRLLRKDIQIETVILMVRT